MTLVCEECGIGQSYPEMIPEMFYLSIYSKEMERVICDFFICKQCICKLDVLKWIRDYKHLPISIDIVFMTKELLIEMEVK